MSSDINNGLITKIWGPPAWEFLHSVTFGYPINPTIEQKKYYKDFFTRLGDILPCKFCRESYKEFITEGHTMLTNEVMKNRDSLTRWFYLIHDRVNNKLGFNYGITFSDVCDRFESYRAKCSKNKEKKEKGCITPFNKKAESYKNAYNKNCPLIPLKLARNFKRYARLRGISNENFFFINKIKNKEDFSKCFDNKCCNLWFRRNNECTDIIRKMRLFAIPSVEKEGRWKGLPTMEEIKLILRFSSNLTNIQLTNMIKKLPCSIHKYKKIYKLVR